MKKNLPVQSTKGSESYYKPERGIPKEPRWLFRISVFSVGMVGLWIIIYLYWVQYPLIVRATFSITDSKEVEILRAKISGNLEFVKHEGELASSGEVVAYVRSEVSHLNLSDIFREFPTSILHDLEHPASTRFVKTYYDLKAKLYSSGRMVESLESKMRAFETQHFIYNTISGRVVQLGIWDDSTVIKESAIALVIAQTDTLNLSFMIEDPNVGDVNRKTPCVIRISTKEDCDPYTLNGIISHYQDQLSSKFVRVNVDLILDSTKMDQIACLAKKTTKIEIDFGKRSLLSSFLNRY